MTIEEAVRLAKQNNSEGQAYLYEQTYKKAYYVSLKYMVNEDDARDVVQDAYIRAFRSIGQLDDGSKFEKWINQIVANTAKNALKKKKPDLFTDVAGDEEYDVADRFEADPNQQPEVVMDQNETARLVQEIIGELSDEQRTCVMMYYFQGMQVKEISSTLEVSDNTVKSRLNYARKSIEAKVKELEKKGTKLYALAPIPFFVFLLHTEADACEAGALAGLYSASGAGNAASAGNAATGATSTASVGGAGAAATGLSLGAKIAIGIISAVVVIGGAIGVGVAVYNNNSTNDNAATQNTSSTVNNDNLPEQGGFEEYLSTQNVLYGQNIDRELCKLQRDYPARNTPTGYKPAGFFYETCARCVYPTGVLGYIVEDVNDDGKDELLQLDIDESGNVTISEKVKKWGKVENIGEKRSININGEFNRVAFYTFKVGKDTYLLMTSGTNEYLANGAELKIYCYKFDDDRLTPIVEDNIIIGSSPDAEDEWIIPTMESVNKVLALQGKSINREQCIGIIDTMDGNIEQYVDLNRFLLLKPNKTFEEMSKDAQQISNDWGATSTRSTRDPINDSSIIEKAVVSSQLITK